MKISTIRYLPTTALLHERTLCYSPEDRRLPVIVMFRFISETTMIKTTKSGNPRFRLGDFVVKWEKLYFDVLCRSP